MIRLLLFGFIVYFISRIIGGMLKPGRPPVEVRGESKKEALDLSNADVEDVEFKEIKK
jgi:hypothetical protein